jgi:drug/metabolite transporter (DMT)-like permease
MQRIGELAAFGTAVSWTLAALFFEQGVKRIGVLSVNFFKVVFAFVLLTITAAFLRGMPLPLDAPPEAVIFLSLSGIVGFVVTDMFLFTAYGTIGPRITMLIMALSPPVTAGIAYVFFDERLGSMGALGMSLVIIGICMTIFGKQNSVSISKIDKVDKRGYIFAFIASIGQSIGIIFTKAGLGNYDPVSGTQIREIAAIIGFALVALVYDRGKGLIKAAKSFEGQKFTAAGSVFGPYIGVVLSLFAIQRISAGIVSTLIGLTPVIIILPEILIFKKKIKLLEIVGAVVAVIGTAIFFLW